MHADVQAQTRQLEDIAMKLEEQGRLHAARKKLDQSARSLVGRWDAMQLTLGLLLLCGIVFTLGHRWHATGRISCGEKKPRPPSRSPSSVPTLFLLFAYVALPHRVWSFCRKGWGFFLVDFCYVSESRIRFADRRGTD